MKKSFLVLICVVFIAAVIAVGIYGLVYDSYYHVVYPESIDCDRYRINGGTVTSFGETEAEYDYWAQITLDRTAPSTEIEVIPTVTPADATELGCTYVLLNAENHAGIDVDASTGTITVDHDTVINPNNGEIRQGADFFEIVVTSNQDASLHQILFFLLK